MLLSESCHLSLPLSLLHPGAQIFWPVRGRGAPGRVGGGAELSSVVETNSGVGQTCEICFMWPFSLAPW